VLLLAFLAGLVNSGRALVRVGLLLAPLVAVAGALAVFAASPDVHGAFAGALRYQISPVTVVQGALTVWAYAWMGQRAAWAGFDFSPGLHARALPQLRFAYMDILLIVIAALLLALRIFGLVSAMTIGPFMPNISS
jgi:hypothetical protein